MGYETFKQVSGVFGEQCNEDRSDENGLLRTYLRKFRNMELNLRARKMIAKQLRVEERNALNWKTTGDIFSFLDSSALAEEHPEAAVRAFKLVAGILAVTVPASIPITSAVLLLPPKVTVELMKWLGKPTPEHILHKACDRKAEDAKARLVSDALREDGEKGNGGKLERLRDLLQKGILTEEEFRTHEDELRVS